MVCVGRLHIRYLVPNIYTKGNAFLRAYYIRISSDSTDRDPAAENRLFSANIFCIGYQGTCETRSKAVICG
jgi:hypothetical protein